jgi:hypothetical protein
MRAAGETDDDDERADTEAYTCSQFHGDRTRQLAHRTGPARHLTAR